VVIEMIHFIETGLVRRKLYIDSSSALEDFHPVRFYIGLVAAAVKYGIPGLADAACDILCHPRIFSDWGHRTFLDGGWQPIAELNGEPAAKLVLRTSTNPKRGMASLEPRYAR
jgi:hypothetical protein